MVGKFQKRKFITTDFPTKMLRRRARERREYLFQKSQRIQDSVVAKKRQQLRNAIEQGKTLPKELAEDEQLQKDFKYDEGAQDDVDDEYSELSGIQDPKVIVTTSRNPSSKLAQFSKEMRMMFPTSVRVNRGGSVLPALVSACQRAACTDLMLLHEHRGVPTALTVSHFPYGPTAQFSLHNVVLRHELAASGNISEAYPHLIFENFTTPLGKRVETILKHLFPPGAKKDSPRVITFANNHDYISVRHHVYVRTREGVELAEIGPRFEMRLFNLTLGTLDQKDADTEWQYRGFVRTANRKDYL